MAYETAVVQDYVVADAGSETNENLLGRILEDVRPVKNSKEGEYSISEELSPMGYYDAPTPGTF